MEAVGRGLGFRSYAAPLAASKQPAPPVAVVTGAAFSGYLLEHGSQSEPAHFYRAAASIAIRGALDTIPKLHIDGIGIGRPQRCADGTWQTSQQQYADFLEHRQECLGLNATEAFLRSLALLARIKKTKTIRLGTNSYRLKHIAENYASTYPEGGRLGPGYVPNGMLIAAAVHMGFYYRTYVDHFGRDAPNTNFNMSKTSIDDLDAEIRGFVHGCNRRRRLA